jgi:D-Tyr-tRNAtyr deacylase
VEASEKSEIVGIIRRNDQGVLERCEQAKVDTDGCVTLIKVANGLVVVLGPVSEADASAIETLLSDHIL